MSTYYIDNSLFGNDSNDGLSKLTPVKSMVAIDKFINTMKAGDVFSISGSPVWGVQTGISQDMQPIYDIKAGCIQHHLIPSGKMRTVIQIGNTVFSGTSVVGAKGEIETVIEKVEVSKIALGVIA